MATVSVVLATYNEEANLSECLESVIGLADEIIVVDGTSTDRTVEIAEKFGAKVLVTDNPSIFHINKQKAIDIATKDWILQLDADERVSSELSKEIKKIISLSGEELDDYENNLAQKCLFLRHQKILEDRDGKIGTDSGGYVAFFIPRLNFFLGRYLHFGGVYPDGVIRLFKKSQAYLPAKNVHEQMVVKGKVGWLANPLYHKDSPTFARYLKRNNRYTTLMAKDYFKSGLKADFLASVSYLLIKPVWWFILTGVRHKGFLDGPQGILFSFFSSLRFPISYLKYLKMKKSQA